MRCAVPGQNADGHDYTTDHLNSDGVISIDEPKPREWKEGARVQLCGFAEEKDEHKGMNGIVGTIQKKHAKYDPVDNPKWYIIIDNPQPEKKEATEYNKKDDGVLSFHEPNTSRKEIPEELMKRKIKSGEHAGKIILSMRETRFQKYVELREDEKSGMSL